MRHLFSLLSLLATAGVYAADLVIPEGVVFEKDIEFSKAGGQSLALNIARPKEGRRLPTVVCIHGGGFRAGTREGYDNLCIEFAQRGYVAATVSYRLSPGVQFPAAVRDCKTAVRWLRANADRYGIDSRRIGAMGGSAGGHLALFLGVTGGVKEYEGQGNADFSSSVKCVVSFAGPSDFTKSYGKSVDAAEVLPLFFGGNLDTKLREHIRGSPLNWVTPNAAPTLCIHGTEDNYVAHEQAEWMVARLKASGVTAELLSFPGAGHGLKGDDAKKGNEAMFEFFDKHLKAKVARDPATGKVVSSSEKAVLAGLQWLQSQQNADGSWGEKTLLTGFALLAYLRHGVSPESPAFGINVKKASSWLVEFGGKTGGRLCKIDGLGASADGRIEHAVATCALCEYFAMTKDETVIPVLEQAVRQIVSSAAKGGGWRSGDDSSGSDVRLTGWNALALKAAYRTERKIEGVEDALDDAASWFDTRQSRLGTAGNSYGTIGLVVSARLEWKGDRSDVSKGVEWLTGQIERNKPVRYDAPHADLEGWLHDTSALLMYGGANWLKWDRTFRDEIMDAADPDGSWPVAGGKEAGLQTEDSKSGAIYRTAVCVLMLEVPDGRRH